MKKVKLPDGSELELEDGATGADAAAAIGPGLAKAALAVNVDGELRDLSAPLAGGESIEIVTDRSPEALTRYRVLRRTISVSIITVGLLSALLVIPQVRATAGGLLASSAIVGLIIGFASQRTLGNFVAGVMIAITQPLRLGDWIEVAGVGGTVGGTVEEIGLMYTFIRTEENARLVEALRSVLGKKRGRA